MELKPSCKNNIFYSLSQQFKSKRRSFYLQNWQIYGLFYLKTKMGMAGLIFEPQPPYFANQCNFCRCTNDVTMTFWYLYWFQICKKPLGVSFPGSSVLWFTLVHHTHVLEKIRHERYSNSRENVSKGGCTHNHTIVEAASIEPGIAPGIWRVFLKLFFVEIFDLLPADWTLLGIFSKKITKMIKPHVFLR